MNDKELRLYHYWHSHAFTWLQVIKVSEFHLQSNESREGHTGTAEMPGGNLLIPLLERPLLGTHGSAEALCVPGWTSFPGHTGNLLRELPRVHTPFPYLSLSGASAPPLSSETESALNRPTSKKRLKKSCVLEHPLRLNSQRIGNTVVPITFPKKERSLSLSFTLSLCLSLPLAHTHTYIHALQFKKR